MDPVVIVALAAATLLSFANGSNDVSKTIATLAGAGVTTYRRALIWGAFWTGVGAILSGFLARALLQTFVSGWFTKGTHVTALFAIAVGTAALTWVLLASRTGFPVSTTHSITGAIVGLAAVTLGTQAVAWSKLGGKIFLPLLVSPFIGLLISLLVLPLFLRLIDPRRELSLCIGVKRAERQLVPAGALSTFAAAPAGAHDFLLAPGPEAPTAEVCIYVPTFVRLNSNRLHWLSSAAIAITRAINDTPKIAAIAVMAALAAGASATPKVVTIGAIAAGMTLGSLAGHRVARRMGQDLTNLGEVDGFVANLVTAGLVGFAANLGLPVSTTHVSNGAIIGVGLGHGASRVRWATVRDFVLAWVVTLPAGALLALLIYQVLHLLFV